MKRIVPLVALSLLSLFSTVANGQTNQSPLRVEVPANKFLPLISANTSGPVSMPILLIFNMQGQLLAHKTELDHTFVTNLSAQIATLAPIEDAPMWQSFAGLSNQLPKGGDGFIIVTAGFSGVPCPPCDEQNQMIRDQFPREGSRATIVQMDVALVF